MAKLKLSHIGWNIHVLVEDRGISFISNVVKFSNGNGWVSEIHMSLLEMASILTVLIMIMHAGNGMICWR